MWGKDEKGGCCYRLRRGGRDPGNRQRFTVCNDIKGYELRLSFVFLPLPRLLVPDYHQVNSIAHFHPRRYVVYIQTLIYNRA